MNSAHVKSHNTEMTPKRSCGSGQWTVHVDDILSGQDLDREFRESHDVKDV